MGRRVGVAVGVLVVGVLAGCTGGGQEPVGLSTVTAEPTPEVTPTPTPTPTPIPETGVVVDLSDPELGIVFEEIPDLTGDEADAYNLIELFYKEGWWSVIRNEVSPILTTISADEVGAEIEEAVANNVAKSKVFGGVLHVTITDVVVEGDTVTATACRDYREVTFTDSERSYTPEEAGFGEPRLMEVTGGKLAEGQWWIKTNEQVGTC